MLCRTLPGQSADGVSAAVIVAHPDDETLWAGGWILAHPGWDWFVLTICRGSDADRAPRFRQVLDRLGARGDMGDLDDGPEQRPLSRADIQQTVLSHLPRTDFDAVFTHAPEGEYTRNRRHEELSAAMIDLWACGRIRTRSFLMFAYEDGQGQYLPRAVEGADLKERLSEETWGRKYQLVREVYGFSQDSWEARTAPSEEAFWCFGAPQELDRWLKTRGTEHEGLGAV